MNIPLKTSNDTLAQYNDAYMRMPRQASHGWCLRTQVNIDADTGNIKTFNDVYFGMADSIFGKFNISDVNPDELPAITNVYVEQIGTTPISLEYTFDWWNKFYDAVLDKNFDLMVELLWEHEKMGLLPEMFSVFKYDLYNYIELFRSMYKENIALLEKMSKSAKDVAFINILSSNKNI